MSIANIFLNPSEAAAQKFKLALPKTSSPKKLKQALEETIAAYTKGIEKAAVPFSGGLDSSLIALLVSKNAKNTTLYVAGIEGSHDVAAARNAAKLLNLPLKQAVVSEAEVADYYEKAKNLLPLPNIFNIKIAIPEFIAFEKIKSDSINNVFSGYGADSIFAGFDIFRRIVAEKGHKGVEKEIWNRILDRTNIDRELALSKHFGLNIQYPFLDEKVAREAMALHPKHKIHSPEDLLRKHALRQAAKLIGLPDELCSARKKSMQYGSGISSCVDRLLKRKQQNQA